MAASSNVFSVAKYPPAIYPIGKNAGVIKCSECQFKFLIAKSHLCVKPLSMVFSFDSVVVQYVCMYLYV